jgi:large repetitive protein
LKLYAKQKLIALTVAVLVLSITFCYSVEPCVAGTLRPTIISVTTSNTNPTVNQQFTLSGYLKDNTTGTPLSGKQIILLRKDPAGVWTNLGTTTTTTNGSYSFTRSEAATGTYLYQVNSQSDALYATSYASRSVLVGTLKPTVLSVKVSNANPTVGSCVTFTATLTSGGNPFPSKAVTIYHYLNGVKYTDITKTTSSAGQITLTQTFGSAGQRTYYATFAGDSSYQTATSSALMIYVH